MFYFHITQSHKIILENENNVCKIIINNVVLRSNIIYWEMKWNFKIPQ